MPARLPRSAYKNELPRVGVTFIAVYLLTNEHLTDVFPVRYGAIGKVFAPHLRAFVCEFAPICEYSEQLRMARLPASLNYAPISGNSRQRRMGEVNIPARKVRCVSCDRVVKLGYFGGALAIALLCSRAFYGRGFLPTEMLMTVDDPKVFSTNLPVFSGGMTFAASTPFRNTAAWIYCGRLATVRPSMFGSGDSIDSLIPGIRSIPAPSSSFFSPQRTSPGKRWGDFILFHPAPSKTLSISLSKSTHSLSSQTPVNMYSVPLNGIRDEIICGECGSDLGVVRRSNFAVTTSALFTASNRCDSASAACFLAETMSDSKESASFIARSAFFPAASAVLLAVFDVSIACLDCVIAVPDAVSASLDFWFSEMITFSESSSFRWPYLYAASSAETAIAKQTRPILSNIVAVRLCLSSIRWAITSQTTSAAKRRIAHNSNLLWANLTESREFQSGSSDAKFIGLIVILVGASVSRLLHYRKRWRGRNSKTESLQ